MSEAFAAWREELFGSEYEIWHDGLDEDRLDRLSAAERAGALDVIPAGLDAGEWLAPLAARKLAAAQFVPQIEEAMHGARGRLAIECARAIVALGGDGHRARAAAVHALPRGPWSDRIDVAIGLRHIPSPLVIDALELAAGMDSEYLVRYHAATSMLVIGGVVPPDVSDHPGLFAGITAGGDDPSGSDMESRRSAAERLGALARST